MIYKNNKFEYNFKKTFDSLICKHRYNYSYKKVKIPHDPIILVCNCCTKDDAKLIAASFSVPMSFAADASHLENEGIKVDLTSAYTAIPIYPASSNAAACVQIIRRIRAGYSVCVFPEGKRSGDGLTSDFTDSVARLVKKLGVCMVTYKIDGAYMSHPSWAKNARRGKTYGHTICVYPESNIRKMSNLSIYQAIKSDLDTDAVASEGEYRTKFDGKRLAEGIENQLYACPCCKYLNTLTSNGNKIICKKCQKIGEIDAFGNITEFGFSNVRDWSDWQSRMIGKLPFVSTEKEIAFDEFCTLLEIGHGYKKETVSKSRLSITNFAIRIGDLEILFDKIKRAELTFDSDLAFSLNDGGNNHFEIRKEGGYAANMYLDILNRFRRTKSD